MLKLSSEIWRKTDPTCIVRTGNELTSCTVCGFCHDIGCADIVFGLDVMAKLDELVENAGCLLGLYEEERRH